MLHLQFSPEFGELWAWCYEDEATIAEIVTRVGYESEASFSKAFKREVEVAPGTYRREGQNGVVEVHNLTI